MRSAIGLAIVGIATVLLVVTPGDDLIAGVERDRVAGAAYGLGALLLVSGAASHEFRTAFARSLLSLLLWIGLAVGLLLGYSYRFELSDAANRVLATVAPGVAITGRGGEVTVMRGAGGSFTLSGGVNGLPARFIFDTGATSVVFSHEDAARLGLAVGDLTYSVPVWTANGRSRAAPVRVETIAIGGLALRNVSALIAQPGALAGNLLGMTFLERLASYTVEGDRLTLRGRGM